MKRNERNKGKKPKYAETQRKELTFHCFTQVETAGDSRERETPRRGRVGWRRPARQTCATRYRLAGAASQELVAVLNARLEVDGRLWAKYCYESPDAVDNILEKARELASYARQGELRNPIRAFQRWLTDNYGRRS